MPPTRSARLRSRASATSGAQRTPIHTTGRPCRADASRSWDDRPPMKTSSMIRPVPQRPIAAMPAYQEASARRKSSPTTTEPSGPNSTEPSVRTGAPPSCCGRARASISSPPGSARIRSSTPSVIHVVPSSRWRLRAMEVLPELEPPFKTITGFTRSTVLPGTEHPHSPAWAPRPASRSTVGALLTAAAGWMRRSQAGTAVTGLPGGACCEIMAAIGSRVEAVIYDASADPAVLPSQARVVDLPGGLAMLPVTSEMAARLDPSGQGGT